MWIQEFVTILKNLSKEQVQLKKQLKKSKPLKLR